MKTLLKLTFVRLAAFAFASLSSVYSAPTLRVSDGINTVTVVDDGPGDLNPTPGLVLFFDATGVFGPAWTTSIAVGVTKPLSGSSALPYMDIQPSFTSSGPATLTVEFSVDGFGPLDGTFSMPLGGNIAAGGTLTYSTFISQALFDETTALGPPSTLTGPGASSNSTSGKVSSSVGTFTLTQKVVVTHTIAGSSTADCALAGTPIPPTGSIGNFVWNDLNGNGIQELGEPGIDGVTVTLKDSTNTVVGTTTTASNGYYQFTGLSAGSYTVTLTTATGPLVGFLPSPTGAGADPEKDSNGNPAAVVLATNSSSDQSIDFGFYRYVPPTGQIGNFVWKDLNQNGIQDDGSSSGIGGVTVKLFKDNQPLTSTTTAADGSYLFTGLGAGNYSVQVDVASPALGGLVPTAPTQGGDTTKDSNPNPWSVVLATDSSQDLTVDFGFIPTPAGSIGDYVWMDLDGDGIQGDPTIELGIPGVTVKLYDSLHVLKATTTTNASGLYLFTGLSAGTYTVEVANSVTIGGYVYNLTTANASGSTTLNDSNPNPATVTLPLNTSNDTSVDFGYTPVPAGKIGDFVWNDLNDNGVQDVGEPGISGVKVSLFAQGNPTAIATTTTNALGAYAFIGLAAGTYSVEVDASTLPASFIPATSLVGNPVTDSNGSPALVTLPSNTSTDNTIDFGYLKPSGSIGDFVWNDLNFNGVQDIGEPGIGGVSVQLYDSTGTTLIQSTTTAANGSYGFNGLLKGAYIVVVDNAQLAAVGYLPTIVNAGGNPALDSNANPYLVNLSTNVSVDKTVDFGYFVPQGMIGDFVWFDQNQNGIQNVGEPGISGVTVSLFAQGNPVAIAVTTTDANGKYLFTGLTSGNYSVAVDTAALLLAGWIPTDTNVGGNPALDSNVNPAAVTLAAHNSVDLTVDFGYIPTPTGSIGDFVWNDLNANGIQNLNEPGIPNVTVRLTGGWNNINRTTTTDAGGLYLFSGLWPGTYTVTLVTSTLPAGFIATPTNAAGSTTLNDSNVNPYTFTLGYNYNNGKITVDSNMTIDFGYYKPVPPAPLVITCPPNNATLGVPYSSLVPASGGVLPYTFAVTSGSLPPGLTLNTTTGAITGTPSSAGSYSFTIQVTDKTGQTASTSTGGCCGGGSSVATLYFNTPQGVLTGSQTYTVNGIPITAYGFANNGTPKALYGKNLGGTESGLGIAATSADNEIDWNTFIQLDMFNVIGSKATNTQMLVNSVQTGEFYNIYGSNTLGSIGTLLGSANRSLGNTFFAMPGLPTYRYISVRASSNIPSGRTAPNSDVLLSAVSFTVTDCCVITVAPPPCSGKIGNFVWKDTNANGIQDAGEPGINNVTVQLYGPGNILLATQVTSGNGAYLFTCLTAGTYTVKVDPTSAGLAGLVVTTPNAAGSNTGNDSNPTPSTVTLATNSSSDLTIDFGYKSAPNSCLTTYTMGGWGSPPNGCNPGTLLANNFMRIFPSGLTVGGSYTLKFTSAHNIDLFLPCGGTAAKLTKNYINPTTTLGVLAGQVVALRLNVSFSNAGITTVGLANAKFKSGLFAGKTVGQVLAIAESCLGGGPLPVGVSYSSLSDACALVNQNYDNGTNCGNLTP